MTPRRKQADIEWLREARRRKDKIFGDYLKGVQRSSQRVPTGIAKAKPSVSRQEARRITDEELADFLDRARAANTQTQYKSIVKGYQAFLSVQEPVAACFPIDPTSLARYAAYLTSKGRARETVLKYIRVLRVQGRSHEETRRWTVAEEELMRLTREAVRRTCGNSPPTQALTLTDEQLRNAASITPHSGRKNSSTAVLLGVAACLRPGELADLREEDIRYDPKTRALYVNVREGKTDVEKQGEIVVVGCCCGPQQPESSHLCPVHRTLRLLQEGVGMRDHTSTRSIFGCSRGELDADIKNILRVVTGSSARATSHALRRSGAQLLAEQGVSAQEIGDHGRWRSTSTVLNTYLRQSSSYEHKAQTYPAKMLGLVQRDLTRATSATDPKPQPPNTRAAMRARPKRNPQSGAGANPGKTIFLKKVAIF